MTYSDDHRLLNHQSTPNDRSILYSETDSSQAINNSTDSYPSSVNNTSVIHHHKTATTLDSPSLWKPTRLPENNSTDADLAHNRRLSHSSTTSSPHHFQTHHSISGGRNPNQNTKRNSSPFSHTTDTGNSVHSTQSRRPPVHHPKRQLETISSAQPQLAAACNSNPPLKKNGKPLAQCPYCGMTFKKLEHCQRHERTHTLARPYPCTVCSKTFARQDTLNRHLRLHSRSEGRVAVNKSSSQSQEAHASASSPGSVKSPPPRERGLSLSALEHPSFPGHVTRDVPMIGNDPRQSASLPLQQSHQRHPPPPFQFNPNRTNPSHISSQQPRSSTLCVDGRADLPTEIRRGSWCPGVQNVNDFAIFSTSKPTPRPISNHSPLVLQRSLVDNWKSSLTTTFGLVETGIGPVPLSAPATCTQWSAVGFDSAGNGSSYATTSSSVVPTWETLSKLDIQSQNKVNWPALGRLEEEVQIKHGPEESNFHACQIISSPSQPDSFEQSNSMDSSLTGSSTSTIGATESEANTSLWSFQSSSQVQMSLHPVNATLKDMVDCLGNNWNTPQKQTVKMFNPVMWHPPAFHNAQEVEDKVLRDSSVSTSNPMPINTIWENNAWEEMFGIRF